MSVLVVVQARTGSSRFPGKVLTDLAGQAMLGFMLDRIAPLRDDPDTTVVVATSSHAADDDVAAVARDKSVGTVRGSEHDVLARFGDALMQHPSDIVVRLTADCPLMDPDVVRSVLSVHVASGADYTSNTLARTFPDGLDVEVMDASALRWAHEHATAAEEREHVTPHLQRHPRRFQLMQHLDEALAGGERWTVDVPADLDIMRVAIGSTNDPVTIGWRDLLEHLGRRSSTAHPRAIPIAGAPHHRGAPYHRPWSVEDRSGPIGTALVVVEENGHARLEVHGARPAAVDHAVREHLRADLQVTSLIPTTGAAP